MNTDLAAQAARLYPLSPQLQRAWLHAIAVVRATTRGWVLDRPMPREPQK